MPSAQHASPPASLPSSCPANSADPAPAPRRNCEPQRHRQRVRVRAPDHAGHAPRPTATPASPGAWRVRPRRARRRHAPSPRWPLKLRVGPGSASAPARPRDRKEIRRSEVIAVLDPQGLVLGHAEDVEAGPHAVADAPSAPGRRNHPSDRQQIAPVRADPFRFRAGRFGSPGDQLAGTRRSSARPATPVFPGAAG